MKKEYVNYFDYLRVMASFCVVYMHVAAGPLRGELGLSWQLTNFFTGEPTCAVFALLLALVSVAASVFNFIQVLVKKMGKEALFSAICRLAGSTALFIFTIVLCANMG